FAILPISGRITLTSILWVPAGIGWRVRRSQLLQAARPAESVLQDSAPKISLLDWAAICSVDAFTDIVDSGSVRIATADTELFVRQVYVFELQQPRVSAEDHEFRHSLWLVDRWVKWKL
ncbi:hypothetical protein MMC20_007956, partial [Loxospora ochrophaea]|nr:hypothetical protein [Loxospora ochrophaea]